MARDQAVKDVYVLLSPWDELVELSAYETEADARQVLASLQRAWPGEQLPGMMGAPCYSNQVIVMRLGVADAHTIQLVCSRYARIERERSRYETAGFNPLHLMMGD